MLVARPQDPGVTATTVVVAPVSVAKVAKAADASLRGPARQSAKVKSERPASPESLRGSMRQRMDSDDRTILRPMATMRPPAMQHPVTTAGASPTATVVQPGAPPRPASARPPAMIPSSYTFTSPAATLQTAPPVSFNSRGGSDARRRTPSDEELPSAAITSKTMLQRPRSRFSWAVGLMTLGAVVGLGSAIVARGDADRLLEATANLLDSSHTSTALTAHASGAVAQAAVLPSFVESSKKSSPPGADANPNPAAPGSCPDGSSATTVTTPVVVNSPPPAAHTLEMKTTSLSGADPSAASRPVPPKPAPVAFAAPVHAAPRVAPVPAAAPAPVAPAPAPVAKEAVASGGWLTNVTPPNSGGPISRPSKAAAKPSAAGNDFETAAAADALAKAQLEASLR
jgi:hypothetical protein